MAGKVGCGLLLAVLFCAAAVSRAPFVVFLLALAMVFTAFLWWDARTLRRQVTAALQLPAKPVRPGEAFAVTVHLQNAGRRTVPELRAALRAEDAESGTAIELPCAAMLAPGGRADLRVTLRAAKSGLWRFKLQKLTVRDHLGLFAADCPPDGQTWELCVLPPAEGEADGAGNTPQNRAEQESRAGQDIADGVYDLRPYRVGDPLKQIHWKLTAKVDELTVREPLGTTYRADPAGTLLAEDGGTPPPVLHFGRAAVTRLRTLTRRKAADPDTGLEFVDRVLLPQQGAAARPVLRGCVDFSILLLLTLGLLAAVNSAFSLALPAWIWPGAAALCALWLALCYAPLPAAAKRGAVLALAVGYLVLLFLVQRDFLRGMDAFANAVKLCLNTRFNADFAVGEAGACGLFVLLALVPITAFFAAVTVWRSDALLLDLVLLPAVVLVLLAGAGGGAVGWLLLLLGCVGAWAAARSVRRRRLWGKKDSTVYAANVENFLTTQKTTAAGMMLVCAVLFLPALALRPVLALPLDALQPVTERARAAALGAAIEWLPKISGGALNFHVSAAAGGVEDGSLTQSDGLALQGLEDLLVTTDEKPTETVYLRGFIGAEYDGHSWQPADAEQFDNAAASWKTDGDSRLAIANLPFLRAAYDGAAPQQMTVQRLHAGDTYTFAPYNAYFNDYYRLDGDGAAAGQTAQDDTFYYFPRGEAKTLLTARADADSSVLDRLESAYAAYAESRYLATPDGADYGTLQEFCDAAEKEHKLTGDADAIRTFVRSYLNEHCTYTSDPPQPADGADPVLYFLSESHAGSSTQFASAAVVLCRMLGLPARYVVGYAAPQSLFAESDGGWQAVLQDDNAHAWAEVYLAGQGWTPLETTPGMVSELTEDQLAANANAVPTADDAETPLPAATPAPEADPTVPQARAFWWLLPLAAVLAALAAWGIARARRTPADTVRAEFRALYKKMCRCGLGEGVSSDQEEFKQFLWEHTKTAAPQDVETLLALVQTAQFAPGPVSAQTAQQVRGLCRILRKNLHR